ncbi:MAG TPA: hypothetical protein VJ327_02880 [Patescibacteria group bacterium]|nr:hypothetical protein [Patescibacteria group bacterium]
MKKVLIGIGILLLLGLGYVVYSLSRGSQKAEDEGKENNPIFHSVPEGGTCRPDQGDCAAGLTCGTSYTCVKP